MQNSEITHIQSLIDRYYEEEKALRAKEQTLAEVTLRLDASDLAMLGVIAKRFQKTREEVAQELVSNSLIDLLTRIAPNERKLMARDADEAAKSIATDIAEENGVHTPSFKSGVWASHDRQITKEERKRAKMSSETSTASTEAPETTPPEIAPDSTSDSSHHAAENSESNSVFESE